MVVISTRGTAPVTSFRNALFTGLAPDGGLYVPAALEPIERGRFDALLGASLVDVAVEVADHLVGDEIPRDALVRLVSDALNFPIPLVRLDEQLWVLELFRGPTFAFKDVGARVMARLMAHFADGRGARGNGTRPLTILVATSGDTGSAVAQAFFGVDGTRVIVLFPEGQVSAVQEAQFTTLGGNITALAVTGSFDDCQRLAKQAFESEHLRKAARLTSANSINIGRLIPQIFYYVYATRHLSRSDDRQSCVTFSVPSGNLGNVTAGLIAQRLGAPIGRFVAASTVNDALARFLATGRYEPRPSIPTLANAMDVGNPSNIERIRWLFNDDLAAMRRVLTSPVYTDDDVRVAIAEVWQRWRYITDPHSAIGYLGARTMGTVEPKNRGTLEPWNLGTLEPCIFLATAHPAKFNTIVEPIIGREVEIPAALEAALGKPRVIERIPPRLRDLEAYLV